MPGVKNYRPFRILRGRGNSGATGEADSGKGACEGVWS